MPTAGTDLPVSLPVIMASRSGRNVELITILVWIILGTRRGIFAVDVQTTFEVIKDQTLSSFFVNFSQTTNSVVQCASLCVHFDTCEAVIVEIVQEEHICGIILGVFQTMPSILLIIIS